MGLVEPTAAGMVDFMAKSGFAPSSKHSARLEKWALDNGLSWDNDNGLPEPVCPSCGSPINVWDGETGCTQCWDCETCCWDNHGGEAHPVGI